MLFLKNQDLNIQHEGKKNKKERKKGTLSINLEYIQWINLFIKHVILNEARK